MVEIELKLRPYIIEGGQIDHSKITEVPGSTVGCFQNKRGFWLFTRAWEVPSLEQGRGIILYHHGIAASVNTNLRSKDANLRMGLPEAAARFVEKGFSLYGFDAESHGYSESSLENKHEKFYIPGHEDTVEDFEQYIQMCMEKPGNKRKPVFIYAQSWGGAIALLTAYKWQVANSSPENFAGVFLCAPAIHADLPDPVTTFVLKNIIANIIPTRIPFFMPHPISIDRVTDEPNVIDAIKTDPYMGEGKPFRLASAKAMLTAIQQVQADLPDYKFPICIVHGEDDVGVPATGSLAIREHSKCVVKDIFILPKCKHAIEYDVHNQNIMYDHFLAFIEKQLVHGVTNANTNNANTSNDWTSTAGKHDVVNRAEK